MLILAELHCDAEERLVGGRRDARITNFSGRADAYRWTEERDGHAVGQQQAERHRASAGWRDALWRMGSCHLPASAGRGVWVPEGGVCGPRDPSSESPARRLRRIDFADRATPRFANCPHSKARCNQKEGQMPKVRLYGTFWLLVFDFIFSRRGCGALAFVARGAAPESFAAGGAHAPLCLLNFLGSSRTLGVVSRSA